MARSRNPGLAEGDRPYRELAWIPWNLGCQPFGNLLEDLLKAWWVVAWWLKARRLVAWWVKARW